MTARYTTAGIRLTPMRRVGALDEVMNDMLVPGGPDIGSESLADLAACLPNDVNAWGVDLPEDGSNVQPDPYGMWPGGWWRRRPIFPAL
jgi:hypothetical protein